MVFFKTFMRYLGAMTQPDIKRSLEEINERINKAFLRRPPVSIAKSDLKLFKLVIIFIACKYPISVPSCCK